MRKWTVVATALVAGLGMSVAGFAVVGPTADVFKISEFTIPVEYHIQVLEGGAYIFTEDDLTNVAAPDYVGWAETDVVSIKFETNTGQHEVTFTTTPYENAAREAVLPTEFTVDGSVVERVHAVTPTLGATTFATMLRVERDGWNDPAGFYEATVMITVADLSI